MLKSLFKFKGYEECVIYILLFMIFYVLRSISKTNSDINNMPKTPSKYILAWNKNYHLKSLYQEFPKLQCKFNNCILTENKYYFLGDYRQFDAIIFSLPVRPCRFPLIALDKPKYRTNSQIYIYFTIESAFTVPACELYYDDFFNWTFTTRLDSDIVWKYFIVQNITGHEVGPSVNVNWQVSSEPVSPKIKMNWKHRTKAAAWLVSNCKADNFRHVYVTKLQENLFHFSLKIDVFGECTNVKCPNDDCESMLSKEYYFYLAFENSFSEDYVTEKVLHGYDNYVVPIVFGSSNYTRFLPPGSYINARDYHPYHLAFLINEAMTDHSKYEKYFSWTNSYTIVKNTPKYNSLCSLCEALNSEKAKHAPVYKNLRLWWNKPSGMKWCLPNEYWNETTLENVDTNHLFKLY